MRFSILSFLVLAWTSISFVYAQNASTNPLGPLGSTPSERRVLNQTQAMQILTAASARAATLGARENIAIVDPAGYLLAFVRNDNAFLASVEVSIKKARTVALFNGGRTTESLQALVQPGAALYGIEQTNGGLIAFGGGLPVYLNGVFVGAVGVGGGSTAQDIDVATTGIRAIGGRTTQ